MAEFVLDGSLALAWCFNDEADPCVDAVAARFPATRATVPAIWPLEIANVVLMGELRRRSTEGQTAKWLGYHSCFPIFVEDGTSERAWGEVLRLARAHRLSAYDGAYLELALRRGLPLATLDEKLNAAALAAGVPAFAP